MERRGPGFRREHSSYGFIFVGAATLAGATVWGADAAFKAVFTESGILSEFARSTLTSQICVSVKRPLKPGMPVNRMPFSAFQYVSDAGSSETPVPWKS